MAKNYRAEFADAFAEYVRLTTQDDKVRARMLTAFGAFLTGEGITSDQVRHFELLAKMTGFAGQVPGGGPRSK